MWARAAPCGQVDIRAFSLLAYQRGNALPVKVLHLFPHVHRPYYYFYYYIY